MSALGQKQTFAVQKGMSALPSNTDRKSGHRYAGAGEGNRTLVCSLGSGTLFKCIDSLAHMSAFGGKADMTCCGACLLMTQSGHQLRYDFAMQQDI